MERGLKMELQTPYVKYESRVTENGYKLLCFPYAGGGASYYARWQKQMGTEIEILPVQLPGRENRVREALLHSCTEIVDQVVTALLPYLQTGNFSIFGHSMGGILGFEVAKRLEQLQVFPQVCFISATSAEKDCEFESCNNLSEDAFFDRVAKYGAVDKNSGILKFPEFRAIYMKILRADFDVIEKYKISKKKIQCPIVAMCGDCDPKENLEKMHDWEHYTNSRVLYQQYTGDHFYLAQNLPRICMDIRDSISYLQEK